MSQTSNNQDDLSLENLVSSDDTIDDKEAFLKEYAKIREKIEAEDEETSRARLYSSGASEEEEMRCDILSGRGPGNCSKRYLEKYLSVYEQMQVNGEI